MRVVKGIGLGWVGVGEADSAERKDGEGDTWDMGWGKSDDLFNCI